jgi:hypothetical protein
MTPDDRDQLRGATSRLRRVAEEAVRIWRLVANSRPLAYLVLFAIYLPPTIVLARLRLLWDDEFFTLYLSTTRSWGDLVNALATGADQHPPSFYYLVHLIFNVFGVSNVTLRLTSIAGFALLSVCLYEIVSRMLNREWGFCAMLLPLACPYAIFSVEARGYGIEVGFVALAFWMWMLAADGHRRGLTIPLLALSAAAAVGSHYYAAFALLPLGAGELTRTLFARRMDARIWVAFCGAVVPILAFAKVIQAAQTYSGHFWAIPHLIMAVDWYPAAVSSFAPLLLSFSVLATLVLAFRPASLGITDPQFKVWQAVALVSLSLIPIVAVVAAKLVTHAFTDRYAIAAIPGICILVTIGVGRILGYSGHAAAVFWVLTLMTFGGKVARSLERYGTELADLREADVLLRSAPDLPIAISDLTRFHRLSFYARRDLAARLTYVSDPHACLRYLGFDTADRGLLALNPWFPIHVVWLHDWLSANRSFVMWTNLGPWAWLPNQLADIGADVRLVQLMNSGQLFLVKSTPLPADSREAGDPTGQPMLFPRMPSSGKPLCAILMTAKSCAAVD